MTEADIAHAKAHAEDVLNGLVQVRTQQARDVIKLAEELRRQTREMQRTIDELRRGMDKKADFGSVFDELMRGKKP